jgi:hypothetical protein
MRLCPAALVPVRRAFEIASSGRTIENSTLAQKNRCNQFRARVSKSIALPE